MPERSPRRSAFVGDAVVFGAASHGLHWESCQPAPVPNPEELEDLGLPVELVPFVQHFHTEHAGDGWAVDDAALHTRQGILLATGRQTRRVLARP